MKQMVCSVCTYTYDEAKGIPEAGIAPGTKWEDLPDDWRCPWCGAEKEMFREKDAASAAPVPEPAEKPHVEQELSPMELSIICSNLARGCEKQYLPEQEQGFRELAAFFRAKAEPAPEADTEKLLESIALDLSAGYPYANSAASEASDRGALRALAWSEKVTRMLQSLLTRYQAEGERMLENTGVFVCSVCGFVYVGDAPPEICPVCKVPSWKFDRVERRA